MPPSPPPDLSSVVSSDLPVHLSLNAEIKRHAEEASGLVRSLRHRLFDGDLGGATAGKGISFLELKNLLMVDYLSDLSYLLLRKSAGRSIQGDPVVDRLVTARTVMEKMRPIEQKLKYQIGKAIKVAESGTVDENDPLRFKANPDNLVSKLGDDHDEEEDSDEDEGQAQKKQRQTGKYVAPKNVPAFFDEGGKGDAEEEEAAAERKTKRQRLSRGLIEDLKRQHLDTPEEVHEREDVVKRRQLEAARERERFEESHFMRLPVSKKARAEMRRGARGRMSTVGSIGDEVTAFGRNFFSEEAGGGKRKGKKRRTASKGSARKKFKKK